MYPPSLRPMTRFFHALLIPLLSFQHPGPRSIPSTFEQKHDINRLQSIRSDLRDSLNLSIASAVFEQLLRNNGFGQSLQFHTSAFRDLRKAILAILEGCDRYEYSTQTLSSHSLPSESGTSSVHTVPDGWTTSQYQWLTNTNAIALEIARTAHIASQLPKREAPSSESISVAQHLLTTYLTSSTIYEHFRTLLQRELEAQVLVYASKWIELTPLAVFEASGAAKGKRKWRPEREEAIDDIARRIAHLGILHWWVWGKICYTFEERPSEEGQRLA